MIRSPRQRFWKGLADDAWRIKRLATNIMARLQYADNDARTQEELLRAREFGKHASWMLERFEALSRELD